VIRLCAWCENPIPAKARRDAVCCSVRCRQARHRFLRAVGHADLVAPGRPLRLAYADPPYPGQGHPRPAPSRPGCGPCAPPLPPIGLTAADPFAGGEVSRADSRVRSPGTFTCARCPAARSALDAAPEAYHNPAAVWWGTLHLPSACRPPATQDHSVHRPDLVLRRPSARLTDRAVVRAWANSLPGPGRRV